ncbi:MAG: circadian clock KaiB family protein [Planktothrix sp. GU0601_MAG3]|nr:MAG: circadian clock KaiB family protein [Planktothrix sp. GU0601_MAG3]
MKSYFLAPEQDWQSPAKKGYYCFRLYVAGTNLKSILALKTIKYICEIYLKGNYDLEVIDVYQQPELTEGQKIIAVPTLIRILPLPLQRIIGDLSQTDKILMALNLSF